MFVKYNVLSSAQTQALVHKKEVLVSARVLARALAKEEVLMSAWVLAQARKHEVLVSVRLIANVSTSVQVRKKQVLVFPWTLATQALMKYDVLSLARGQAQVHEKEVLVSAQALVKEKVLSSV